MIQHIEFHTYKKFFGETRENHTLIQSMCDPIIKRHLTNYEGNTIDLYNMAGEAHRHHASIVNNEVCIFVNAKDEDNKGKFQEIIPSTINGIKNEYTGFHSADGADIIITSPEGTALAEWREDTWSLNILFDLFGNNFNIDLFEYIMKEFNSKVWLVKSLNNSWMNTTDKVKLIESIQNQIVSQKERSVREDKHRIVSLEREVREYQNYISNNLKQIYQKRRAIMAEDDNTKNISTNIINDLDLVCQLDKVKDIVFKDNIFTIFTNPLNIYDEGVTYYGGNYQITINLANTEIKFFGDNPRPSYWTNHDPHPHVDGSSGDACLGNIGGTIAELCNQSQLYALALICIDFLESTNTDDEAGKNIIHWDIIEPDGCIIPADIYSNPDGECQCEVCDNYYNETFTAFGYIDDDGNGRDERQICQRCADDNYYWNDDIDAFVVD